MFLGPSAFQLRCKFDKKHAQSEHKSNKKLINNLAQISVNFSINLG